MMAGDRKHINLGIVAHVDAGKTTLTEALLYKTGAIRQLGRVDSRDSFLDTDEQERERGITIFSKQARFETDRLDITLLDTPGHVDFSAEAEAVLQVLDYCILVISGTDGVKGHTLTLWSLLKEYDIPTFIFINKMDRPGIDRDSLLKDIRDRLSDNCIELPLPRDLKDDDLETIAMCDEALMERYLDTGGPIGTEEIAGLILNRLLFPVYFGSALKLDGIDGLLDGLGEYTLMKEHPDDFAARVFKITRDSQGNRLTHMLITGGILRGRDIIGEEKVNQIRLYSSDKYEAVPEAHAGSICAVTGLNATKPGMGLGALEGINMPILEPVLNYRVHATDATDTAILLKDLRILEEEDPQLNISFNENTREIRVRVMGRVQLEVLERTVRDRFGTSIAFDTGSVVYKETIKSPIEGVGHFEPLRHYAEAHILLDPQPRGSGLSYDSVCSEDILDKNWQRLILTHLREKMHRGVLTGAPVTDIKMTLVTGRAHLKHTEGGDFRQATYRAVRQGLMMTESLLLEPYYYYRIELPSVNVGRAMTDIEKMSGTVEAPQLEGENAVLTGRAPVVCIQNYASDLAAYTSGTGTISLSLAGYDVCHNADEVIEASGYIPEADLKNTPDSVFCAHGAGYVVPWNEVREHMHVETPDSIRAYLEGTYPEEGGEENTAAFRARAEAAGSGSIPRAIGTDEVDAILNKTFYSNSSSSVRAEAEKRKGIGREERTRVVSTGGKINDPYDDYKYKPVERKKKYLIVDGYNVIFAWKELKELAAVNIDGARDRLVDIISNYAGATGYETIVVFDAYKVKGRDTSSSAFGNITVVYTKEDETADQYIEKFTSANGRKYDITVATSDNLERTIARGNNCMIVSSAELEKLVEYEVKKIMDEYSEKK
ncbi:MAG: TetM/TetW/TetO/TetS family tetracycline resistance ribosomal protection protein [Lachnospiraceae bacterium]|nr:TetM/TetW/TetO/TetS family tetracycline resistance ribosomal protection protein [Lachnospiraceae bacterium]